MEKSLKILPDCSTLESLKDDSSSKAKGDVIFLILDMAGKIRNKNNFPDCFQKVIRNRLKINFSTEQSLRIEMVKWYTQFPFVMNKSIKNTS